MDAAGAGSGFPTDGAASRTGDVDPCAAPDAGSGLGPRRVRPPYGHFIALAIASVLGWVMTTALFVALFGVDPAGSRLVNPAPGDLLVGDCLAETGSAPDVHLRVVPCEEPHTSEVLHAFELPLGEGASFPTRDAVSAAAEKACLPRFEGYLGERYEGSALAISLYTPSASLWEAGAREAVCTIEAGDGSTLKRSLRASRR